MCSETEQLSPIGAGFGLKSANRPTLRQRLTMSKADLTQRMADVERRNRRARRKPQR